MCMYCASYRKVVPAHVFHPDLNILKSIFFFYIHCPVYRESIIIRSNEMQQYAGVYLLQNYSICFGCLSHPSSGINQTVNAASGTGHITCQSNNLPAAWPRWRKVVALTLWPVPEARVTVSCTPDDGCDRHPKHVE